MAYLYDQHSILVGIVDNEKPMIRVSPSNIIKEEEILNIIDVFIEKEFEGGRHERRIKKIDNND